MLIIYVYIATSFFTAVAIPVVPIPHTKDSEYASSSHYTPPHIGYRWPIDPMLLHDRQSVHAAVFSDHRKLPSEIGIKARHAVLQRSWENHGGEDFIRVTYSENARDPILPPCRVYKLPNPASAVLEIPPDSPRPSGPSEVCQICGHRVTQMASLCDDEGHKACLSCLDRLSDRATPCHICRGPLRNKDQKTMLDCVNSRPPSPRPPETSSSPVLDPASRAGPSASNPQPSGGRITRVRPPTKCGGRCSIM